MIFAEHARLKEHVTSMTGGLEAKINEGFVILLPPPFLPFSRLDSTSLPRSSMPHVCQIQYRNLYQRPLSSPIPQPIA
jgi:hypothetical protein